ncbi:hypothetical protein OS493_013741 [Desmophyllum pertusum]|uniref:Uncharacterized protein n=1 Tax=Desmophyllum pertusum TaxID=174260 RepID=A0A9X0D3N7_9CNID|nr:hypothetical protein OS493_013741 [Desmophyllum pertusum]
MRSSGHKQELKMSIQCVNTSYLNNKSLFIYNVVLYLSFYGERMVWVKADKSIDVLYGFLVFFYKIMLNDKCLLTFNAAKPHRIEVIPASSSGIIPFFQLYTACSC